MKRSSVIALIVGTGVVVVGIIVAVILLTGGSDEKAKVAAGPRPTSATTESPTTSTTLPDTTRPILVRVEGLLNQSAVARKSLNESILSPFRACALSGSEAAVQMTQIISNRSTIHEAAGQMALSPDPTERDLGGKLAAAMQMSLESNYQFQHWFERYSEFSPCQLGPPDEHDSEIQLANAYSTLATAGKAVFVAAYDSAAARFGMKSDWTERDI